jgi:predicted metalloprotease with PDZ domain
MKYTIRYDQSLAHNHFLQIEVTFPAIENETMILKLPSWRPGRYELGNFAKNIKDLSFKDENGNPLKFAKRTKDEWFVQCHEAKEVHAVYTYYANELNAGASYVNEEQLYVNPVNCLIYQEFQEDASCDVTLVIPPSFHVATSLLSTGENLYYADTFHELVDSPIIASPSLQHNTYESNGVTFYLWFQGEVKPDWGRLLEDFQKFTDYQIEKFGKFPVSEYHYMFQIDTKKAYHGVEHQKSTMIYLGPSYMVFEKLYTELLGVCSHELYHTWNVKAIRPEEMYPYDYNRENYSRLGYVAEGVTTYMGDRTLFESGVFDDQQYHKEIGNYIMRHLHNDGRKHYSVADSSFDTWLDGYVAGIPGRKTSIYVEGALIAYICDMRIREATKGEKSLHDAMQMLYNLTRNIGYSDATYQEVLEATSGTSFDDIFEQLINGTDDYMPFLLEALEYDGRELVLKESLDHAHHYGLKGSYIKSGYKVSNVLEGSAADRSGLVPGDVIHGVNGISLSDNLSNWLAYFKEDEINVQILRETQLKNIKLSRPNDIQFKKVVLSLVD